MSAIAIGPNNETIALLTAPADVREWATVLNGTEARALADTKVLRCGASGCAAPLHYGQGEHKRGYFSHPPGSAEGCVGFDSPAGEWHLYMQYSVFKEAYAHEYKMQSAIADIVIKRKNTDNRFAVEIQHSPISKETVLARHAAHKAAGMMGTVWIIDGDAFKSKNRRVHTSWVIDLFKACIDTPGKYPCTVLVYKDKRSAGGQETTSIVSDVELGHEPDGREYAVCHLDTDDGSPIRFSMEALSFLAQGPKRANVSPLAVAGVQAKLDSLPTRRIRKKYISWNPRNKRQAA